MTNQDEQFLREAIQLAREGMTTGQGGPFGSVIVKTAKSLDEVAIRSRQRTIQLPMLKW